LLKKFSAIFSLFLMMLCGSGFYIAWYTSLQSVRNSQRAIISNANFDNERIVKFAFSKEDFKTNTDLNFDNDNSENEFEYKQQMYDVINQKTIGDSIYFSCISDEDEDHLNEIFIAQILESGNNTGQKQLPIFKFRIDHFTNDAKNGITLFHVTNQFKFIYKTCIGTLPSPYLSTSSPPPKFFFA